jgi:hypothetical protein
MLRPLHWAMPCWCMKLQNEQHLHTSHAAQQCIPDGGTILPSSLGVLEKLMSHAVHYGM